METEYIPIFCDCSGIISGKIGTRLGFCLDCKSEYEIVRRIKNE
jgi:hypothetical protein